MKYFFAAIFIFLSLGLYLFQLVKGAPTKYYGKILKNDFDTDKIILAKCSFCVDQLIKDNLINKDLPLKKIFDFLIETFDINMGTSTKFKSDYSIKKYIENYMLLKSKFE